MTENEAIEKIKYRMHTVEHVAGEGGMEDLEMAVKALEEVQRWHTSVINPNIKNEFANTSTRICHNCDHKDEYIEELEAEVEEYRAIGTPEECRVAVEKQTAKKPRPIDYKKYIGIVKNAEYLRGAYWCLNCNQAIKSGTFCKNCGQKLDWSDEE